MENIKGLKAIKDDITSLRGTEVRIFGQPQVLESEVDELTIDILDIIENLESYEVETIEMSKECTCCNGTGMVYTWDDDEECELEEECEECDGFGTIYEDIEATKAIEILYDNRDLEELNHDNSYNWLAPVSNNFNLKTYKDINNDKIYVEFKVHRFGDVRSNYTDTAILEFDYDSEFLEAITEADKFIDVDGFDCNVKVLSDTIEVNDPNGNYCFESSAYDIEELKEEIREYKIENDIE